MLHTAKLVIFSPLGSQWSLKGVSVLRKMDLLCSRAKMLRWSTLNVDRHFHTKVWHVCLSTPLNWIYKEGEGIVVSFRNTSRRKERAGLQMEKAVLLWSWLKTVTKIKRKDSICMKNIVQCKIYLRVCLFLQLSALNASGVFEGLVTIKAAHHCQLFFYHLFI